MTRREELERIEREARQPEPAPPPLPEPAVLALQRTAGNQATARFLQRQPTAQAPNLTIDNRANDLAWEQIYPWFDALAGEVRQREAGSPIQSTAELVYMACELEYTDQDGKRAKVREHVKPSAIESYIKARAKQQGITLLDHRDLDDVRGLQAEATAILGNLGRLPTELTFGNDNENITISIGGKLQANVGALHLEGETLPEGGAKGSAKIKGKVGEVEAHGSPEGAGASIKTPGGTKVGVDFGKGVKAEVKAGDLITVKGGVVPEGDGKVSWNAQITIGNLGGNVIGAEDIAKVMGAAQDPFSTRGAAILNNLSVENVTEHGPLLKKAVTEVAEKAKKSAAQAKPGVSVTVGVKGDKTGGYSGAVTLTWVF
jgi:hypothetical protein